jgi:hypothetical protein
VTKSVAAGLAGSAAISFPAGQTSAAVTTITHRILQFPMKEGGLHVAAESRLVATQRLVKQQAHSDAINQK